MSFLEESSFGEVLNGQSHQDLFEDNNFLFEDDAFGGDSLMGEFDPSHESIPDDCASSAPTWPQQAPPSEPSQWTPHQSPVSPPAPPFFSDGGNNEGSHLHPMQSAPQQQQQQLQQPQFSQQIPQSPQSFPLNQPTSQPQSVPQPPQPPPQQQPFGYPQYSSYQQQQQPHFSPQQQQAPFSPQFSQPGGFHFKKRRTLTCPSTMQRPNLRPLAPQIPQNNQFVPPQYSAPPTPPPPPPKGHLTGGSMAHQGAPSAYGPYLAPSLSDSETRHIRENDFGGGELRMIAPKPPSLPPADFHRRTIQKPPRDAVISPSPPVKRTRGRTKRRSSSKLGEQKLNLKLLQDKQSGFLGGSELRDQLAILSAKCAASEAESKALKERLSATESELAELRAKVQQFGSLGGSMDQMISPVSPLALSPCDSSAHSPSMISPDIHHSH